MATQGLFMNPEDVGDARLMQLAQMDPNQRLFLQAARSGQQLGQGIGSLFGQDVRDPAVIKATQMRELAAKYGVDTAEGLDKIAMELQATDPNMAIQVKAKAYELRMQTAKLQSEQALTAQRMREKTAADPIAQFARANADKFTPASLQEFAKSGNYADLDPITPADKFAKPAADWVAKAVELGFGDKARLGDYTPEQAKAVNSALLDESLKSRSAGAPKTTVSVNQKGEEAFAKQLGELDAKKVAAAIEARDNAATTLNSLSRLSALNDQGLISGTFAAGRVGATNLLNTLGLASPADAAKLAASENYQKTAGDVILQTLGGKLGGNVSEGDRKFVERIVPQLENSPSARRELIDYMAKKNTEIFNEAQRLEDYARKNNGLGGFKAKLPIVSPAPATQMSADELAKAAGGRIVNGKFVPNAK